VPLAVDAFVGRVLSHYRLEERLGAGGMGILYRGTDLKLGRAVAVKLLARHLVSDETAKARFIREARAASALDHPNIATIYEIGEEGGELFIAMALYEGETLKQRLSKGRLGVEEALDVLRQVSLGLEAAHRAGIVHRDIKPANILITSFGTVKILDFGLAKLVSDSQAQTMTQAGQAMGTILYMSPEQLKGLAVDARSDLWSLGVLAYEMLAGVSPFQTDSSAATVARILHEEPPSLAAVPGVPDWLAELVSQLLRKNPAERPETTSEVLTRLRAGEAAPSLPFEQAQGARSADPGAAAPVVIPTEPAPLASWFAELKRRRVFRALVGYGIAAFAVLQIIEPIMHGLHWPETVLSYVVAALAAGFPIVITLAWVFDVKAGRLERTASPPAATGPRAIQLALFFLGLGLFAAAPGLFYYFVVRGITRSPASASSSSTLPNKINSLVVLPFVNASGNTDTEYLSDGITEELINNLSQIRELQVIARTTAFRYKGKEVDFQKLGRDLSVDAVLTGRVQQLPDSIAIQADLVNISTGLQLWGERYERKLGDVSAMQQDLTRSISEKLVPRLTGEEQGRVTKRETTSSEAYQLYLRGRYFYNKRTKEAMEKSVDYFQQAIDLDAQFALAYAGLGSVHAALAFYQYSPREEALSKSEAAAQKALALDEGLAEAHSSLGSVRMQKWEWSDAEAELKRAIALNPNDATARNQYGLYLVMMRRLQDALAQFKRGQQLDPASPILVSNVGWVLCKMGRYDRGIAGLKDAIDLDPNIAATHGSLAGACYGAQKMFPEAIEEAQKAVALAASSPGWLGELGVLYAGSGKKNEAVAILEKLKKWDETRDAAVSIAQVYVSLGDNDSAIAWLEKAYQRRSNRAMHLKHLDYLEPLRADARFKDLFKRMGFPE
jgi:TolB-like protein/Tfp pilus assembly protein PilF